MQGHTDPGEAYDEVFDGSGAVRAPYADVVERLRDQDLDRLTREVNERLAADGVVFGGGEGHPFRVDPVPRLLTESAWAELERGIAQRTEALNTFVADAYAERRAVAAGVVPERVLTDTPYFETDLLGCPAPADGWLTVAGFDLVRDRDGRFRVLEDNLRTPSGLAYAEAANDVVADLAGLDRPEGSYLRAGAAALRRALESSAPDVDGELLLVSDGEDNSAWFEHRRLAGAADLRLVEARELRLRSGRVELADGTPVRSFYRRSDDDHIRDGEGRLTPLAETVLEAVCEGRVGMVNRYGTGVGDDKMLYGYVDDLIRFYLGQEPALPSVATYDVLDPGRREAALERLPGLVAKPRDGQGGHGVVVGPTASAAEIETARAAIAEHPETWIVQDVVELSTCPVVVEGRLEPRHVDLRVFAIRDASGVSVVRGGLTRVALAPGSMVVNSSREGGAKATWVVPDPD